VKKVVKEENEKDIGERPLMQTELLQTMRRHIRREKRAPAGPREKEEDFQIRRDGFGGREMC